MQQERNWTKGHVLYTTDTLQELMGAVLFVALLGIVFVTVPSRAAAWRRRARSLKPGAAMLDAEEYFHLALHASAAGDHHACMTYLEEVLRREPRNARAIYLMAVQHAELGLTQRAIAGIKRALSIEPDLEIARFQLGLLLMFDSNQPSEAKDYLERLCVSENRALRAYSEAMIAMVDNEPGLARQKLAVGLSESAPDSPLSLLMRRLFERMSGPACDIRLPG
jgi:tetratricopeptide (TPR) repeat protein